MNPSSSDTPILEPLLSTRQLAEYLGLLIQSLYDLRNTGRGPAAIKVGRELRFRASVVAAWLADLERAPGERAAD